MLTSKFMTEPFPLHGEVIISDGAIPITPLLCISAQAITLVHIATSSEVSAVTVSQLHSVGAAEHSQLC